MSAGARLSLAILSGASLALILVGASLVWFGVAGYEDWDFSRRLIALVLGLLVAVGMSTVLILLLRQQVAGRPAARATPEGLAVGATVIPWDEIDDVGAVSLYGLPHVAIVQSPSAPKRLPRLGAVWYLHTGGLRGFFLAERQLGMDLEQGIRSMQAARSIDTSGER